MAMRSSRIRMRRQRESPRVRVGRRISPLSVNRMVPNVLTLLALCAGMTAIRFAMGGKFQYAVYAIIAAGIFDGLDGRLARLLKATSRFGAELDSLSDFISFGVAPAALLYLWTMAQWHSLGWAIVLFYAVCCALRLARFNSELAAEPPPPWRANFFSGAPAPAGAGLLMLPMFVSFEWGDWIARSPYLNGVWITGTALLMISTVPTVSLKRIRIPHHRVVPTLLGVGLLTAFFTTAPWPTLISIGAVYLVSIPLTIRASDRMRRASAVAASAAVAGTAAAAARAPTAAEPPPPALPAVAAAAAPQPPEETAPPPHGWRH
jgi:CDP-diacylglycerol---serine O-phosphatidyltransferase